VKENQKFQLMAAMSCAGFLNDGEIIFLFAKKILILLTGANIT
jgi:hypothetical protein